MATWIWQSGTEHQANPKFLRAIFLFFSFNMHTMTIKLVYFCSFTHRDKLQPQSRVTLRDLQKSSTNSRSAPNAATFDPAPSAGPPSSMAVHSEQPDTLLLSNLSLTAAEKTSLAAAEPYDSISLADVTVPLESIKPSKHKQ